MDDAQIIALYLSRDETAIGETETKYGSLCLHIAKNILGNQEDAEECVQDTFLAVWNTVPPTLPENFPAFLCKIARNLSLKKLEYNTAGKRDVNACTPLSELEAILPDNRLAPDAESKELGNLITAFLQTEKETARKVFLRRYMFFDSIADIARQFSFRESKVKSILFRTRSRLRDYLKKEGIEV